MRKLRDKALFIMMVFLSVVLVGCGTSKAEYEETLRNTADDIFENSQEAESLINQYLDVWDYSIKSRGAISFDEMIYVTGLSEEDVREHFPENAAGNISSDFSVNISSLHSYFESKDKFDALEKKSIEIKEQMQELKNPPSEYERAYEEVLDLYAYGEEFIGMALDPSGSLQSFTENKNNLTSDILEKNKKIEALISDND